MKIECSNCRMVSEILLDRIVTDQKGIDLFCPTCNFAMTLQLTSTVKRRNLTGQAALNAKDQPADPDSGQIEATAQRRTTALKAKILRSLVNLPPMPHIILKAREILSDPDSSLKDLARVIETDQAMVARILTLANSAYYGVSGMISSIQHASVLLGQKTLGQMITISASSAWLNKKLQGYDVAPDEMWRHSLACAFGAKRIAEIVDESQAEDAFTAGLLHDAGKIILDPYVVKQRAEFQRLNNQSGVPLFEAEKAIIGFDHAEIMSRACRLWRFPDDQVRAIRYHHQPICSAENRLTCIIHLANGLAKFAGLSAGPWAKSDPPGSDIMDYLNLRRKDAEVLMHAVADDLQKIEAELQR